MTPANEPLIAWRNARYVEEWTFVELGGDPIDFTDYTAALFEVRQYGAQAGAAFISLAKVVTDVQGVRFIDPTEGTIRVRINQATLQTCYEDNIGENEPGSALVLVYDLRLTASDGAEELWLEGEFTIEPGSSIGA